MCVLLASERPFSINDFYILIECINCLEKYLYVHFFDSFILLEKTHKNVVNIDKFFCFTR